MRRPVIQRLRLRHSHRPGHQQCHQQENAQPPLSHLGIVDAVSQAEGRRWWKAPPSSRTTRNADVERYKPPRPNPQRVVIEIAVADAMGTAKPPGL